MRSTVNRRRAGGNGHGEQVDRVRVEPGSNSEIARFISVFGAPDLWIVRWIEGRKSGSYLGGWRFQRAAGMPVAETSPPIAIRVAPLALLR